MTDTPIPEKTIDKTVDNVSENKPSDAIKPGVAPKPDDTPLKLWVVIALSIAVVLLYALILDMVMWHLLPSGVGSAILHSIIVMVLLLVVLVLCRIYGKIILVEKRKDLPPVSEEIHLTPHGVIFSRIVVPSLYAIVGVIVFVIALLQLQAQNKSTRELLESQEKAIGTHLGKIEEQNTTHKDLMDHLAKQLDAQNRLSIETLKIAQSQVAAEQFNNAIINLGSEHQAVVLGGIHALNRLAIENDKYRQSVFDILCSFIREETQRPAYKKRILEMVEGTPEYRARIEGTDNKAEPPQSGTSPGTIQTIMNILFLEEDFRNTYKGCKVDLYGAFLQDVKFGNAKVNWAGADLRFVDLQEVVLKEADMQEALLWQANLQGVMLGTTSEYTNLQEANLWEANLQMAVLAKVILQKANLEDAKLQGAVLSLVVLSDTDLSRADLRGVQFYKTTFLGTKLDNADFRGVQSGFDYNREAIKNAVKTGTGLKTDLSGIILHDEEGNKLDFTEDQKKEWFREQGANVDELSPKEVQDLYDSVKEYILRHYPDFEENEEFPQPEDAPAENQSSDNP